MVWYLAIWFKTIRHDLNFFKKYRIKKEFPVYGNFWIQFELQTYYTYYKNGMPGLTQLLELN